MVIYIYVLIDPTTNEVRYVGKSTQPKRRYSTHLWAKEPANPHKNNWINKLKNHGLKPILNIIEETTDNLWPDRERHWIAFYREINGDYLLNLDAGGEGGGLLAGSTKLLIGQRTKDYWANNPERREKMGKAYSRIILCSDGQEFDSIKAGAIKLNIQQHTLRKYCETGEVWNGLTFAYLRKRIKKDSNNSRIRCIETGHEYNSIFEAAIMLSTSRQRIKESLKHGIKIGGNRYEYINKSKVSPTAHKTLFKCIETGDTLDLDQLIDLTKMASVNIYASIRKGYVIKGFHYQKIALTSGND